MNKQIVRLTYVALGLVGILVVMTTYWTTWASAGLADRQDNAIKRVAEFSVDRGLILSGQPRKRLARNRPREAGSRTLYFRKYPTGELAAHLVGYSTVAPLAHRSRALAERLPDLGAREPLEPRRQRARRAARKADPGQRRRHARSTSRRSGSRCSSSATSAARSLALDPRTGKVLVLRVRAELRPEPRRGAVRPDLADRRALREPVTAPEPRDRRPLRAGLDVQGRDRGGSSRIAQVHARARPSTTPATASSTASA